MCPAKRINPLSTDVMSVAEAARRCQMSPTTVKKGIVNKSFPGHKVEGRYVIRCMARGQMDCQ